MFQEKAVPPLLENMLVLCMSNLLMKYECSLRDCSKHAQSAHFLREGGSELVKCLPVRPPQSPEWFSGAAPPEASEDRCGRCLDALSAARLEGDVAKLHEAWEAGQREYERYRASLRSRREPLEASGASKAS